jgi:hypothetical protein
MVAVRLQSLVEIFRQIPDGRCRRGVRHPMSAILSLVFLGLLARIREMAVLERWARAHWDQLKEPLGFTQDEPPHATTVSRALAACPSAGFAQAFVEWVRAIALEDCPFAVAVDAKTSCQGFDADGSPVQMLTALVHDLKLVIGQWSVRGEKSNEPTVFRQHLPELLANFPLLRLVTGDAIYAQRPLAEALMAENCDYLLPIKGNQPDVQAALQHCLGSAHERKPAASTCEKKGTPSTAASYGSTWTTSNICATR